LLYSVFDSRCLLKTGFGVCYKAKLFIFGGVCAMNEWVFLVSFEGDQIVGSYGFGIGLKLPLFSSWTGFLGFISATLGNGVS